MTTSERFEKAKTEYIEAVKNIEKETKTKNKQNLIIALVVGVLLPLLIVSGLIIFL